VWPDEFVSDQNLTQRVYQLRRLVEPLGVEIVTVRGVGYRLASAVEPVLTRTRPSPPRRDPTAAALYERALVLLDAGQIDKAVALLERVRDLEPRWVDVRTRLAWGSMWLGRPNDAHAELEEADRLVPADDATQRLGIDALVASFAGDASAAIDRYELLRLDAPDDYWLHVGLMGLYQLVGRVDDAEALLADLERIRPGFFMNDWQRGCHELFERGDLTAAAGAFRRVVDANPDYPLPLAVMAPALVAWEKGRMDAAMEMFDDIFTDRFERCTVTGKEQFLAFRSRLLAELGDVEAAIADQALARSPFAPEASLAVYHRFEEALLRSEAGEAEGEDMLVELAGSASSLARAEALGWLGVTAARRGDADAAVSRRRDLRRLGYDGGWEWGFPTRPAFDRARMVFPLLIDGWVAVCREDYERAAAAFSRARRLAPERMSVVPSVSLGGRAHLEAVEGLAVVAGAVGDEELAAAMDEWTIRHRLETVILARAGAGYLRRAEARRSGQSAGTTSATPIE